MPENISKLFFKFTLLQILIAVTAVMAVRFAAVSSARERAQGYVEANKKALLSGDYRQAGTNLRAALDHGFNFVTVQSQKMGLVLELGERRSAFLHAQFEFPVTPEDDDARAPKMYALFIYGYGGVLLNTLLICILVLAFNSGVFVILRSRIAAAMEAQAESEHLRELGNIARGVAHDLRSPLSIVRIGAQKSAASNPDLAQALGMAVERIDGIANHLLERFAAHADQSVPNAPSSPRVQERTDLEQGAMIVSGLLKEFEARYPAKAFVIVPGNIPKGSLRIPSAQFGRLLSNLLTNGAEAAPADGGRVTLRVGSLKEGLVQVAVEDNGPARSRDKLRKQLRPSIETVEAAGGSVTIESEEGKGTTVLLSIPYST